MKVLACRQNLVYRLNQTRRRRYRKSA